MADRRWERTGKGAVRGVYAVEQGQETDLDGMVPEKKLYAINRVCKEDKRPIEDGIGPVSNTYLHRESTSTHKNRAL